MPSGELISKENIRQNPTIFLSPSMNVLQARPALSADRPVAQTMVLYVLFAYLTGLRVDESATSVAFAPYISRNEIDLRKPEY